MFCTETQNKNKKKKKQTNKKHRNHGLHVCVHFGNIAFICLSAKHSSQCIDALNKALNSAKKKSVIRTSVWRALPFAVMECVWHVMVGRYSEAYMCTSAGKSHPVGWSWQITRRCICAWDITRGGLYSRPRLIRVRSWSALRITQWFESCKSFGIAVSFTRILVSGTKPVPAHPLWRRRWLVVLSVWHLVAHLKVPFQITSGCVGGYFGTVWPTHTFRIYHSFLHEISAHVVEEWHGFSSHRSVIHKTNVPSKASSQHFHSTTPPPFLHSWLKTGTQTWSWIHLEMFFILLRPR